MTEKEVKKEVIDKFSGKYRFLSNFHPSTLIYEGKEYPTAEHLYQALKYPEGSEIRELIRTAATPALARTIGRSKGMRTDWDEIKIDVMRMILRRKFLDHANLMQLLLDTGDAELIEGNWWGDTFWGKILTNGKLYGQSWLGKLLMELRTYIRETLSKKTEEKN